MTKPIIHSWPDKNLTGSKRAHLWEPEYIDDWFVGYGKDESCQFEGTWWDMICMARQILASENTRLAAPEMHMPLPEACKGNYTGGQPYEFDEKAQK
jgi:hypothetical protein